jgi:hypothetical protein
MKKLKPNSIQTPFKFHLEAKNGTLSEFSRINLLINCYLNLAAKVLPLMINIAFNYFLDIPEIQRAARKTASNNIKLQGKEKHMR